ncbi:MAG: molybdopterin-binding protein [Planctomycetota bacterium]
MVIGDELLAGKIRDENLWYLAAELRALGADLACALFVGDSEAEITGALDYALARAEHVLTTGGVGPTHDDRTLAAIAAHAGVPLVRDPDLERAVHEHYPGPSADVLSMADVPQGAELIYPSDFYLPIVKLGRVHVFPGVPGALKLMFDPWKQALAQSPYHCARRYLDADEGQVAPAVREVQERHPQVAIGSYPRFDAGAPYRVMLTVDGKDPQAVATAAADLTASLTRACGENAFLPPPESTTRTPNELA